MCVELEIVEKIDIIGPSGAGKSTLAQKLGPRLGLNVHYLDRYFWQPNWRRNSREIRTETLQNLVRERRWVIEGTYIKSELHLIKADVIVYLDISPFKCCFRIIKRHIVSQASPRPDLPEGSSDKLTLLCILKALLFPLRAKRKLENKLRKFSEKVIRLQSSEEVERFLAEPGMYINKLREPSFFIVNEASPVLSSK
jgi:adenylate kinase family enzyme